MSANQLRDAGVASTLPAPSVARTWNVWFASLSEEYVFGVVHADQPPPSRLHSKVDDSDAPKSNVALADGLTGGGAVGPIVVSGAVTSTTHVYVAGDASVFPALSVALTEKVCDASLSPAYDCGLVQVVKAAPSRLQVNEPLSDEENENDAAAELDWLGGLESIVVAGAVPSYVKLRVALQPETLPAVSCERACQL